MDKTKLFLIDEKDGFGPTFSHLVAMMNYTRDTTFRAVQGLTIEELDFLVHPKANSIGMLLAHFAAVEKYYQIHTFENREMNEEEEAELLVGLELGEKAQQLFRGQPLEFYLKDYKTFEKPHSKNFKHSLMNGCLNKAISGIIKKQIIISNGSMCLKMN